jgi:hypothetical protein
MRRLFVLTVVLTLSISAGLTWHAIAQGPATYNLALSRADASTDAKGRLVVTMVARGDLPGTLTLALDRAADGTVTGGEWALMVSYTAVTSAAGELSVGEPEGELAAETGADDSEALVQKGALKGDVAGGTVSLDPDGTVRSLNGLVVSVTGGTLAYERATNGNGLIIAINLADHAASNGTASLIF